MRRILRILIVVIAVAAVGAGGYLAYRTWLAPAKATNTGTYTQVVTVTQGSLSSSLSVVGQLEAVQSADLTFEQMTGATSLLTMTVDAGNTVSAGQVLAGIDPAPYRQALDQATSDLQSAEETLADLQTPPTQLEIAQADMAIASAEQKLEQAKANLADLRAPDLSTLEDAVQNAQDSLDLFSLQVSLSDYDSLAKSERDLQYSISWYERHIGQLQQLVAEGKANLEETEQIATEQDTLAEARAELARVQAERELDRQANAAELARDRLTLAEAQEALAKARAGGDALSLAQAEVAVEEAQVAVESARDSRARLDEGADAVAVANAQAAVDRKRLAVADAQTALTGTRLVAPFDGTVLKTYVSRSDPVAANTVILTLADLKSLQVIASVDETTIRRVSAGQAAVISFDAFPGQTFPGQVLSVPLQGSLQGGVTVYDVPVSLGGADQLSLLVGMTANVGIQVGSVADALLVPTLALQKSNGSYTVSVPNTTDPSGAPETVPVEVGLSDGTYTQIVKGLNLGDQVLARIESTDSGGFFQAGGGGFFSGMFGETRRSNRP